MADTKTKKPAKLAISREDKSAPVALSKRPCAHCGAFIPTNKVYAVLEVVDLKGKMVHYHRDHVGKKAA